MSADRQTFAQLVIVGAISLGGWFMMVEPKLKDLRELEADLEVVRNNPMLGGQDLVESLASRAASVAQRARQIHASGALARDSSGRYDAIMDLADELGVEVRQITPGVSSEPDDTTPVGTCTVIVDFSGHYEQTADFLQALESLSGYARISSITLSPDVIDGEAAVRGRATCELLCFAMPPGLASMLAVKE